MHQVMFMRHQFFRQCQRIGIFTVTDKRHRRYHCDTLFPQAIAFRQFIQPGPVFIQQIKPHQMRTSYIHQIPVIDPAGIAEIKIVQLLPVGIRSLFELLDRDQKGTKACFVIFAIHQFLQFRQRCLLVRLCDTAGEGNDQSEEYIAFGILSRPRFKETLQENSLLRIRHREKFAQYKLRRHGRVTRDTGRSPSKNPMTLLQTVRAMTIRTSSVCVPIWGVRTTLSISSNSGSG